MHTPWRVFLAAVATTTASAYKHIKRTSIHWGNKLKFIIIVKMHIENIFWKLFERKQTIWSLFKFYLCKLNVSTAFMRFDRRSIVPMFASKVICRMLFAVRKCELLSWEIKRRKRFQHRLTQKMTKCKYGWVGGWLVGRMCIYMRKARDITRIQRRAKVLLFSFQNAFCSRFSISSRPHTHKLVLVRSFVLFWILHLLLLELCIQFNDLWKQRVVGLRKWKICN